MLAPIYDNGASFSTKLSDEQISHLLQDEQKLISSATNTIIGYELDGKILHFRKLLNLQDKSLKQSIERNVPLVKEKWQEIVNLISEIPNEYDGIKIISEERKEFYIKGMHIRMEHQMTPAFEQIQKMEQNLEQMMMSGNI